MFREMSFRTAWRLLGGSMLVLAYLVGMLCPCGFAPGWANGWPGLSKHAVFAGVMTGIFLLAQVALAAGLLAFPCAGLERAIGRNYVGWSSFLISMSVAFLFALYMCTRAFPEIRDSIAREWP